MQHPIFRTRNFILAYLLTVIVFISVDISLAVYGFKVSVSNSLIQSVVYGVILFALGLSLWYPFFYLPKDKGAVYIVIQFVLLGLIFGGVWIGSGSLFLFLFKKSGLLSLNDASNYNIIRLVSGVLVYLLFLAVYYIFVNNEKLEEQNRKEMYLKNMLKQAELDLLKSQLNPHFLFNSLNSVSSLTITSPGQAREMINKLSDFLRYSLRNNNEKLLTLKEEVVNLKRYIDIEKVRFGDKLIFSSEVEVAAEEKLLPSLILQPLLENAIKYGVYDALNSVEVELKAVVNRGDLRVIIKNGYEDDALVKKGEGVGLTNIKKRLINIYNRIDLISITDEDNVFAVELVIPQLLKHDE